MQVKLDDSYLFNKGTNRACYIHPSDKNKCIKITISGNHKETNREIKYYNFLKKKKVSWEMLALYYGNIDTNLGEGECVELIRDYDGNVSKDFDGSVSKSLKYYIDRDGVDIYKKELEAYKQYFLDYLVIFNYGMMPKNILRRRTDENSAELVLIDGLGDVSFFTFPSKIPHFARKKILRRWAKFEKKYLSKK